MSTSSPTFHALETYVIFLSNDTWHLMMALEQKYLHVLIFKTVSDILDHPVPSSAIVRAYKTIFVLNAVMHL